MAPVRRITEPVARLQRARVRALTDAVEAVGGVNMGQGNNLLPAPQGLIAAVQDAMREGRNDYAPQEGVPELLHAIAQMLRQDVGLDVDPASQLRVTSGATGAFYSTCRTLLGPGDEAIVFEPCYPYHLASLAMTGCSVRFVRRAAPRFEVDPSALAAAITDRTRVVVLCNPDNPTGRVLTDAELDGVVAACRARGIVLVVDEVYDRLVYDRQHLVAAARPEARDGVVTVTSFSKTLAITGWRVGYLVGPADLVERITLVHDALYVCAPRPFQHALAAFLPFWANEVKEVRAAFRWRRDLLIEALRRAGFDPLVPEGAYYVLCGYADRFGDISSMEATSRLLKETGVATVPASTFYGDGYDPRLIRFCFALPESELRRGIARLGG